MQHLKQDLVYARRTLRRTPGFTFIAVVALALGIGANTAIFSLINAVLLRPLPFPDAGRLVSVSESGATGNGNDVAPPNFLDWRSAQRSFTDLAAFTPVSLNLTGVEAPENLEGLRVTASVFSVLGVQPSLGRTFGEASDVAGGERVVVLSDELWRSRFQADPGIIGRVLTLDEEPHTVIGVMPAGFRFPIAGEALLWVPMAFTAGDVSGRGAHYLGAAGRLAPGVSLARAQADMDVIARRLQREYPVTNEDAGISLVPLKDSVVGPTRTTFLLLWGAVGFVLLIATANVASMLLARAAGRER
ncbi:MAG: ABC transporter permease, partial [Gemmatimonadales bacterium]